MPSSTNVKDHALGFAKYITARVTFFLNSGVPTPLRSLRILLQKQSPIENMSYGDLLHNKLRTYHLDSVTPAITDDDLPLVLSCEPFRDVTHAGAHFTHPSCLQIAFPPSVNMEWEGDSVVMFFEGPHNPHTVSSQLVDSLTFFSSGVIAYSVALLLHSDKASSVFNAGELLTIFAKTNTAGILKSDQVTYHTRDFSESGLLRLAKRRLATLRQRAALKPARPVNIFHFLTEAGNSPDHSISHAIAAIDDKLNSFVSGTSIDTPPASLESASAIPNFGTALSIEVLASEHHDYITKLANSMDSLAFEKDRNFLQCLSGLTQNVFDLRNQGDEEVRDSLAASSRSGTDITFASKAVGLRFTASDLRGYEDARFVVGSDPYWLLVHLVAGHNDFLLSDLATQMMSYRKNYDTTTLLQQLEAGRTLRQRYSRREPRRLMERATMREVVSKYLESPFKYDAEITDYRLLSRETAMDVRWRRLREEDQHVEHSLDGAMRAALEFGRRRAEFRISLFLLAFGLLQVGGAMASLDAIWPDQGWRCLALSGCSRTNAILPYSGIVFRVAFLLSAGGLSLGIAVSVAFFGSPLFSIAKATFAPLFRRFRRHL